MTNRRLAKDHEVAVAWAECGDLSPAQLDLALRILARVLVRSHDSGNLVANVAPHSLSSRLTVARDPSPHPCDDAA